MKLPTGHARSMSDGLAQHVPRGQGCIQGARTGREKNATITKYSLALNCGTNRSCRCLATSEMAMGPRGPLKQRKTSDNAALRACPRILLWWPHCALNKLSAGAGNLGRSKAARHRTTFVEPLMRKGIRSTVHVKTQRKQQRSDVFTLPIFPHGGYKAAQPDAPPKVVDGTTRRDEPYSIKAPQNVQSFCRRRTLPLKSPQLLGTPLRSFRKQKHQQGRAHTIQAGSFLFHMLCSV